MVKENEHLKKRDHDFGGLLESGELEAQIQFQEQELADYKSKLTEERNKRTEDVQELKEEISELKKAKMALQNNTQDKKLLRRLEKDQIDLMAKNQKYE